MFNMLNNEIREGKNSPMVCKLLDWVSAFRHCLLPLLGRPSYLLERMDLRDGAFLPVGLRIAFCICGPTFVRIRTGRD
jgi:hypothetical protein